MAQTGKPHYISIQNSQELHAYFRYAPDRPIVISGHRGGMLSGYPENCIESFEKTLSNSSSMQILCSGTLTQMPEILALSNLVFMDYKSFEV